MVWISITKLRSWPGCVKALTVKDWLPLLFIGWLMLVVVGPDKAYRIYFHALIYPLAIYLLFRHEAGIDWRDSFLRLFLVLCGYMAITTWFVGSGSAKDDAQATRWGLEAALGMVTYFIWMPAIIREPRRWGRIFLAVALVGVVGSLVMSASSGFGQVRLSGPGAMSNPIQAASIILVFSALGFFLLQTGRDRWFLGEILLLGITVTAVGVFVLLTKSRAPIAAMAIYCSLVALVHLCRPPVMRKLVGAFVVLLGVVAVLHITVGLPLLFDQLISRGSSYRLDIWYAYLSYPPESLLFGNGAGADAASTDASRLYLQPIIGTEFAHPHNIWIGAYSEIGIIGLLMQIALVALPASAVLKWGCGWQEKFQLLGLIGLFLMLTFTDEHSLLVSLKPVWVFGWSLLVFVWFYSRYNHSEKCSDHNWPRAHK